MIGEHLPKILAKCPGIIAQQTGEQQLRVLEDGEGEMYVSIRQYEIRPKVPKEQGWWKE